jgi:hypothetical protein
MSRSLAGTGRILLGLAWPSLAAVAASGVLVVSRPAWNWWEPYLVLWFLTSVPAFGFVYRGAYHRVSAGVRSRSAGAFAIAVSIPVVCLGLFAGAWLFARLSLRLGYVE